MFPLPPIPPHIAAALDAKLGISVVRKASEPERLVTGWASVIAHEDGTPLVDLQGDVMLEEDLVQMAEHFMAGDRVLCVQHLREPDGEPVRVGKVVESFLVTTASKAAYDLPADLPLGWLTTVHVEDDTTWARVEDKTLTMFSIGGTGVRTPFDGVAKALGSLWSRIVAKYRADQRRDPEGRFASESGPEGRRYKAKLIAERHIASRLREAIVRDGGITFDPVAARNVTTGYAVGEHPEASLKIPRPKLSAEAIATWQAQHADLLAQPGAKIGGWWDKEGKAVWLDVTTVYPTTQKDKALKAGRRHNQISIANLGAIRRGDWDHAILSTGGTGAALKNALPGRATWVLFDPNVSAAEIAARLHLAHPQTAAKFAALAAPSVGGLPKT